MTLTLSNFYERADKLNFKYCYWLRWISVTKVDDIILTDVIIRTEQEATIINKCHRGIRNRSQVVVGFP